jgi:hypothetical protein
MEGLRQKTLKAWVKAEDQIGPIPSNKLTSVIKGLRQCFTNRDNPWKSSPSNESFQRDLDEIVEADGDFRRNPSLFGLLDMEAELVHRWEKLTQQFHSRTQGLGASASVAKGKYSKQLGSSDYNKHAKSHDNYDLCQGCNRFGHLRPACPLKDHPDFFPTGNFAGSADKAIEDFLLRKGLADRVKKGSLRNNQRADGRPYS